MTLKFVGCIILKAKLKGIMTYLKHVSLKNHKILIGVCNFIFEGQNFIVIDMCHA